MVHISNNVENSKYYHSYIHSSLLLFLIILFSFTVFTSNASAYSNYTVSYGSNIGLVSWGTTNSCYGGTLGSFVATDNYQGTVRVVAGINGYNGASSSVTFYINGVAFAYISTAYPYNTDISSSGAFNVRIGDTVSAYGYSYWEDCASWGSQIIYPRILYNLVSQQNFNTISGYIKDINGVPVNGSTVSFLSNSTTTNSLGYYTFSAVSNGNYTFTANKIGYTSGNLLVNVSGSNVINQNITIAIDYNNTNTIIVSSTTDYNNPITTTTTPNIYLTTWINNSLWSWFSPLYTAVYMIDPDGYTQPIENIWGQSAYQQPYTIYNPIKGIYTFKIYCSLCYPTILSSTTLTYSKNATMPTDVWFNSVKIPNSLNALSVNYHINSSEINYTSTHMQLTYQGNCKVNLPDTTNIPIIGYDGYQNIDTIVYNKMLNRGYSEVCVRADLMNLNNTILDYDITDYFLYYIPDTPTPNPTPPPNVTYTPNPNVTYTYPTPMPTPTSNVTVIPTYPQPTATLPNYPNGNNTGNFTGNNATNNASGWSTTINNISGYIIGISSGIGNITNTTNNLSGQLNSVNQTKSRTILLPAFTYALPVIPLDIKLLFLYIIILVGVLLLLDR
jgi:hypothetical protein